MMSQKRVGIWGWWQGGNLGDNWILSSMQKMFGATTIAIDTSYCDFSGFDFVICGGGGLFVNGVPPPWNNKINIPHGFLGIGTEHGAPHDQIKQIMSSSDFFYVRDEMTLHKFGLNDKSLVCCDVTFYDPLVPKEGGNKILFIWRLKDLDNVLYSKDIWRNYIGRYVSADEWRRKLSQKGGIQEHSFDTKSNDIYSIMKDASVVVSQRYHGLVAAIQMGIPCIGLDICPKIRALMNESCLGEYCIKIGEIDRLDGLYEKCLNNRSTIRDAMNHYTLECNKKIIEVSSLIKTRFLL